MLIVYRKSDKKIFTTKDACECGRPLPWHLFELADKRFEHRCFCGCWYAVKEKMNVRMR